MWLKEEEEEGRVVAAVRYVDYRKNLTNNFCCLEYFAYFALDFSQVLCLPTPTPAPTTKNTDYNV